jgi:HEAT repeat protein
VVAASGCGHNNATDDAMRPELAAASMLIGSGNPCFSDAGCGPPGARGACVLATCFGLLTTDSAAARASIADRLERAPVEVHEIAQLLLLKAMRDPQSGRSTRLGAIEGLGRLQKPDTPCDDGCGELRALLDETDEALAVAARLALARRRDAKARQGLIIDLRDGTEHLRCAAARALRIHVGRPDDKEVVAGLVALLSDPGPVVRQAAMEALAPVARRPEVAAALRADRAQWAYALDRIGAGQPAP